jgi:hypothetical protein
MKTGFLRAACWPLASTLCVLLLGADVCAQTVRPVINELVGNPVKGRVEYVNDSLTPLNVVLEARSFAGMVRHLCELYRLYIPHGAGHECAAAAAAHGVSAAETVGE